MINSYKTDEDIVIALNQVFHKLGKIEIKDKKLLFDGEDTFIYEDWGLIKLLKMSSNQDLYESFYTILVEVVLMWVINKGVNFELSLSNWYETLERIREHGVFIFIKSIKDKNSLLSLCQKVAELNGIKRRVN